MIPGRIYVARARITSVDAVQTMMHITAAAAGMVRVFDTYFTSEDIAASDRSRFGWFEISAIGTPTDTDIAATEFNKQDPGSNDATTVVAHTVTAGEPTYVDVTKSGWGVKAVDMVDGYQWEPPLNGGFVLKPGQSAGFKNLTALTSISVEMEVWFEEIGATS